MKILYISDLDGTLLRSDARTSAYTNQVINELTAKGMLFSYATARSRYTSAKVTSGLNAKIPIITYNGAVIQQNETYEIIMSNTFRDNEKNELLDVILNQEIYPIVYSFQSGSEKFSFHAEKSNPAVMEFVLSRRDDERYCPVGTESELGNGQVFYFTCIEPFEKLNPLYRQFKDKYHCILSKDFYSDNLWLEIMPKDVSKANAALQLKELLGADRIVAFGDGRNDIEMFETADESYAVENAVEELKTIATGMIESNDSDGVAKWLLENYKG